MKPNVVILYHDDLDGRCAGALTYRHYNAREKSIVCHAMNYGSPVPVDLFHEELEVVVIVDYTLESEEDFKKIEELSPTADIIWIDHHQRNIDNYPERDKNMLGKRANTKPSGAMLAWQYFYDDGAIAPPLAVVWTSDYDTWTHDYPESILFNFGMGSVPGDPDSAVWQRVIIDDVHVLQYEEVGTVVLGYVKERHIKYLKKFGFETEFHGHSAIACNAGLVNSTLFDSVATHGYDILMPFNFDGDKFTVSMYSKTVDVSVIAKEHGGGGHPGASGFQCKELPFKKIAEENL